MKVGIGTVEKFTSENMGIVVAILSLGGTERGSTEVHLGVIYPLHLQHTVPLQHEG